MLRKVSIIGSFQKYYNEILDVICLFKENGIYVSSPKESFIRDKIDGFVIFDSDEKGLTPSEIQMITLERIVNSDAVYVYNPGGYIGRTTCYEIGVCLVKRKPLFFYDIPIDLPIPIDINAQVLDPKKFATYINNERPHFFSCQSLCDKANRAFVDIFGIGEETKAIKKDCIVVCGSMAFYNQMAKCQQILKGMGIRAIIPREENAAVQQYSEEEFIEFKRRVSMAYLKKIREKNTTGVLIYNEEKKGKHNYIGANTLVELAMAFAWNRKIFLLNDIYEPLKDELTAWGCISLHGNIEKIKDYLANELVPIQESDCYQLSIFDME